MSLFEWFKEEKDTKQTIPRIRMNALLLVFNTCGRQPLLILPYGISFIDSQKEEKKKSKPKSYNSVKEADFSNLIKMISYNLCCII